MGADLYIKKLPKEAQMTGFRRDIEVGYWRDAYNNSNLLWQFGLSYWTDLEKYQNKEGEITPAKAKDLLAELKKREPLFEKNMAGMLSGYNPVWDYDYETKKHKPDNELTEKDRQEWVTDYQQSYREFKDFLSLAVKLNSPIECSC